MIKWYSTYYKRLPKYIHYNDDKVHLLNEFERNQIQKTCKKAIIHAAILGALGVVLYFFPIHIFPKLSTLFKIEFFEYSIQLPLIEIFWGLFLMIAELFLLALLAIKAVNDIANHSGFYKSEHNQNEQNFIFQLGIEAKDLGLASYGINPFQEVNKYILLIFGLLLKLKGFIANKLLQYLVKRLLGRYAIRYIIDYMGIPIYMAINAYGIHVILQHAKICIFGRNLIDDFIKKLKVRTIDDSEKELIYDVLQLIAMSKRDYHKNHFLLTERLFELYQISIKNKHVFEKTFYERIQNASDDIKDICQKIVVLGFILDGKISYNESKKINHLYETKIIAIDVNQLKHKTKLFREGKPFEL